MAEKSNKKLIIGGAVAAVVVIVVIVGVVALGGNKGGEAGGETDSTSSEVDNTGTQGGEQGTVETSGTDFSEIDVVVEFGDYDEMYTQAKSIQNGGMVGTIIQIDGIVSHPMSKYSVVEEDESGNKIGTEFIIEGADEDAYPNDGDHVIITGEVVEKEALYYVIKTTPEYVEVVEEVEE